MAPFEVQTFVFNFDEVEFIDFLSTLVLFVLKKSLPNPRPWRFSLILFPKRLRVVVLTPFNYLSYFQCGIVSVWLSHCFSTIYCKTKFSLTKFLRYHCWKPVDYKCQGWIYFWTLLTIFHPALLSTGAPNFLDDYSFRVCFKTGKEKLSNFLLLFQDSLLILGPLPFHTNFQVILSTEEKKKITQRFWQTLFAQLQFWINCR